MKKYIGIIATILGLSGWVYLDYQWDDIQIRRYANTDWIPAAIQDNAVIYPWNFVKCSASGIWFIRNSSLIRLSGTVVIAEVMHIDRDAGSSIGFQLFDCASEKVAFLSEKEATTGDLSKIKWHEFEPIMPGGQLLAFVSDRLDSIPRQNAGI